LNPLQQSGILIHMTTSTLQVSLPPDLQACVEAQVEMGAFSSAADYIAALIRDDRTRFENHLVDAMKGPFIEITDEEWEHGDITEIAEQRFRERG
jgi:Arc/MetJ-type ribon-helix-helix transcriptional regulator